MSITEHSGSKHDWIPLTKSAQGIYLAAIIDPKNPCYNTAEIMECPPETNLDYLREAFIQLYRENEGFRVQTRVQTGRPEQFPSRLRKKRKSRIPFRQRCVIGHPS